MRAWLRCLGWTAALWACAGEAPPLATVQVDLLGGPNPGSYDARSQTPACTPDLLGEGSLGIQLSDWTGPKQGLRSLQLVIPADRAPVDSAFYLGMVFGDFFTGTAHEIETRADAPRRKGKGRFEVKQRRDDWTVTITGLTNEGVGIAVTIACHVPQQGQRDATGLPTRGRR